MLVEAYRPGRSPLHRLDPRVKLPLLVLIVVCIFLRDRSMAPPVYVLVLFLAAVGFLGFQDAVAPVRMLLPLLLFIAVLTPFFTGDGIWVVNPATIGEVYRLFCRLLGVSLGFYLFFRTTETEAFIAVLQWYGLPFRAGLVMGLALRWIPSMMGLYRSVEEAHSLRVSEARTGRAGAIRRVRQVIPTLTSVLIQSIRQIPALAMALESRGVGRPEPRTRWYRFTPLRGHPLSMIGGAVCAGLVVLALVIG